MEDTTMDDPSAYPPLTGNFLEQSTPTCYHGPPPTFIIVLNAAYIPPALPQVPVLPAAPIIPVAPPQPPPTPVDPAIECRRYLNHLAKQVDRARLGQLWMLGLPETVYQSYDVNGFIRTWLEDNGINTAILADFRAANKLEELVRHHAILIGDEFFLPGQAGKTATITSFTNKNGVAVSMAVNGAAVRNANFENPSPLFMAMQAMAPAAATPLDKNECWTQLRLRRQGADIGPLQDLRQRYNRWKVEMAGWAEVERERAARA